MNFIQEEWDRIRVIPAISGIILVLIANLYLVGFGVFTSVISLTLGIIVGYKLAVYYILGKTHDKANPADQKAAD